MTSGRRSMLLMTAFVALWAAIEAIASRLRAPYSPYQIVFTRYAVHLALMLALWGWRDPGALWRTRRPVFQLARSLLMLAMPASFVLAAQRGIRPATTLSIFWLCAPLLVLVLARAVHGERPPLGLVAATALASAGAFAASRPGPLPSAGLALVLLPAAMAASFALYFALTRSLRGEATRANLFYTALGVALALSAAMPRLWITPSLHDLGVMAAIGALGLAGLWALDRAAAGAPVSTSAPVACLQAIFVAGLDLGLRRAQPIASAAAGLSLVAVAALYVWIREPALVTA